MNCSGTGVSFAFRDWITCCSRSFSRLDTRIASPWMRGCTLGETSLICLTRLRASSSSMPCCSSSVCRTVPLAAGSIGPGFNLEGQLPLDQLALQHVDHGLQFEVAWPMKRDLVLPQVDRGA